MRPTSGQHLNAVDAAGRGTYSLTVHCPHGEGGQRQAKTACWWVSEMCFRCRMCQTVVGPGLPRVNRAALALPSSLHMHHWQAELPLVETGVESYISMVIGRDSKAAGLSCCGITQLAVLLSTSIRSVCQHYGLGSA